MQRVIVLAVTAALGRTAHAHVAPSVDDNNRYLKVTPGADRIRLAYTVFFGEVPGRQMRPSLDTDRDREISDPEAQTFGTKLALEVAAALELTLDGATQPIRWATVAVGMGSPEVTGGSFSVDMVAWICLRSTRGRHTVLLRDRFRVPTPGETEVRVEDGLGVTIEHARVGATDDPTHDYKFVGPGGPLMDDGLDLAFVASDKAPLGDKACAAPPTASTGSTPWVLIALIAGIVAVAGAFVLVRRQRPAR